MNRENPTSTPKPEERDPNDDVPSDSVHRSFTPPGFCAEKDTEGLIILGWCAEVDPHVGSIMWTHPESTLTIWATPGWEDNWDAIAIQINDHNCDVIVGLDLHWEKHWTKSVYVTNMRCFFQIFNLELIPYDDKKDILRRILPTIVETPELEELYNAGFKGLLNMSVEETNTLFDKTATKMGGITQLLKRFYET